MNRRKYFDAENVQNYSYYRNITIPNFDDELECRTEDLPPPCYNTPVITDIRVTVERATLGSGGNGGGRTGSNCG